MKITKNEAINYIDYSLRKGIETGKIKKPLKITKRYIKTLKYLKRLTKSKEL